MEETDKELVEYLLLSIYLRYKDICLKAALDKLPFY